jgi:hypothetical protein
MSIKRRYLYVCLFLCRALCRPASGTRCNTRLASRSPCILLWIYSPLLNLDRFFSLLILHTVGRTPWTGDQPVARPLATLRTTQTQDKRTQTPCLEWDSNPRSQRSSEWRQFMPQTARPLWWASSRSYGLWNKYQRILFIYSYVAFHLLHSVAWLSTRVNLRQHLIQSLNYFGHAHLVWSVFKPFYKWFSGIINIKLSVASFGYSGDAKW